VYREKKGSSMFATINDRHRIDGTRISIYDVLTYSEEGWSVSRIAALFRISSAEVQAALDYVAANRETVMETYRKILARIEKGNPPEHEAKLQKSHQRFLQRVAEAERRKELDARHLVGPQY
jgi:uncharacterized protein (DUF433 family)